MCGWWKRIGSALAHPGAMAGRWGRGQRLEQHVLEKQYGRDMARQLWDLAEEAKAEVARLIKVHKIDCNYRAGIAHACWRAGEVPVHLRYVETLARDYGYDKIEILGACGVGGFAWHRGAIMGGRLMKGRGISILCAMCWGWGGRRWLPGR